jgi:hypothetical protein
MLVSFLCIFKRLYNIDSQYALGELYDKKEVGANT